MTAEELRQSLSAAGWSCRVQRGEVVLEVCYFCGNEKFNLELSAEKGVFHCWNCRKGGRVDTLIRELTGQSVHIPVQRGAKKPPAPTPNLPAVAFQSIPIAEAGLAAHYLNQRGISPEVAAQYGMVLCTQPDHRLEGRIAIPSRDFWTGDLMGWVGRSYTGRIPKYISTLDRKVITGWRQRDRDMPAVIVEGPLDGVTVHRSGFQVAVLSGTGGAGVKEWAARLHPRSPIAIMLDGDALPQAHQLYWQILPLRTARLVVVGLEARQDPASLGVEGAAYAVRQALSRTNTTVS